MAMNLNAKQCEPSRRQKNDKRQNMRRGLRPWAVVAIVLFLSVGILLHHLAPKKLNISPDDNPFEVAGLYIAHLMEFGAIGLICIGVLAASYTAFIVSVTTMRETGGTPSPDHPTLFKKEDIAGSLILWLLLGLEFAIAADIIKTAVLPMGPEWNAIGTLAGIIAIRAFLGYMLEKDLETTGASKRKGVLARVAHALARCWRSGG